MTSVTSVFRVLPIILLGLFPFLVQASAAERSAEVAGSSLVVDDPCARQVTIATDPALHGRVAVEATADHPEEIDRLSFDTQGAARVRPLRDRASCWTPAPDRIVHADAAAAAARAGGSSGCRSASRASANTTSGRSGR